MVGIANPDPLVGRSCLDRIGRDQLLVPQFYFIPECYPPHPVIGGNLGSNNLFYYNESAYSQTLHEKMF